MSSVNRLDGHELRDDGLFRGGQISASLTQIADHSAIRDGFPGFGKGIPHVARSLSVVTEIEVHHIDRWVHGACRKARSI